MKRLIMGAALAATVLFGTVAISAPAQAGQGEQPQTCYEQVAVSKYRIETFQTEYEWTRTLKAQKQVLLPNGQPDKPNSNTFTWNGVHYNFQSTWGTWVNVPDSMQPPHYGDVAASGIIPAGTYGIPKSTSYRYLVFTPEFKFRATQPQGDGWTKTGNEQQVSTGWQHSGWVSESPGEEWTWVKSKFVDGQEIPCEEEPTDTTEPPTTTEPPVTEPPVAPPTAPPVENPPRCPEGQFPQSYAPDAECVPEDPCLIDPTTGNGTTMWHVIECQPEPVEESTPPPAPSAAVAAAPQQLPDTGVKMNIAVIAVILTAIGALAIHISKQKK